MPKRTMSEINGHEGLVIMPVVFLKYRGQTVPGSYPTENEKSAVDKDTPYPLLNELVSPWRLTFRTDEDTLDLSWSSDFGFQAVEGTSGYPVPGRFGYRLYNRLGDAQEAGKLKVSISFRVQFYMFFYKFLAALRDDDPGDLSTLGGPANPLKSLSAKHREILDTFTKHKGKYVFTPDGYSQVNLPCDVEGDNLVAKSAGQHFLKLDVYLRAREELKKVSDVHEFVTAMVAADWTALYGARTVKSPSAQLMDSIHTWGINVQTYMVNYTRLKRGKKILDQIVQAGKAAADAGAGTQEIIQTVRDEIDRRVITANAWGAPRESRKSEGYQYELMWLLRSLALRGDESPKHALPILRFRLLATSLEYTPEQRVHFILQAGVGHCSEHAQVAFLALKALEKDTAGAIPTPIISSGQTRTDHALVIVGVLPRLLIPAKFKKNNPHYTEEHADKVIFVWDLRQALDEAGGGGYVCDPYLQRVYKNARAFLEGKTEKTDFVLYRELAPDGMDDPKVDVSKGVIEI